MTTHTSPTPAATAARRAGASIRSRPTGTAPTRHRRPLGRLSRWVAARAGAVVAAAALATAALAVPMLAMTSDETASQEPDGPAFAARDAIDARFGADIAEWVFVMEAPDGDLLDSASLRALDASLTRVRTDPDLAPLLLEQQPSPDGPVAAGAVAISDVVDAALHAGGREGLAAADETAIRDTVAQLVDEHGPESFGLSALATRDTATGWWSAPAATLAIVGDAALLDGHPDTDGIAGEVDAEVVGRDLLTTLAGDGDLDVFGVAIDQTLTAREQGQAAGPFIGMTILAIVLLTGLIFRSYLTLAVVGGALLALLVWLQGLSNLLGLKSDQILSTVVPIAMIAFGVDYAFHAVGRYREQRRHHPSPRPALARALGAVTPALALALATGVMAFAANTASGIESIVQFGIAASVALAAAFLLLGIVVPASLAVIEARGVATTRPRARAMAVGGGILAATAAMVTALLLLFIAPALGIAVLAGYLLLFVVAPTLVRRHRTTRPALPLTAADRSERAGDALATVVAWIAARRKVVLPTVGALTLLAGWAGLQVPASFDVEDFFAPDTGFVQGLDRVAEHAGDQSGERADILVTADLDDPATLDALDVFVSRVETLDTDRLARQDGRVAVDRRALDALQTPGSAAPAELARLVAEPDADGLGAVLLGVGVIGSRAQEHVEGARELLEPLVADLVDQLTEIHPASTATLTGTPIVRQATLDGVARSLRVSVPIAVLLCLLAVGVALRSWRYALISLVPILLVVAWLHGFMYVAGFSLNLVTATIGAISIGIGIDLAVHMAMRFREETRTHPDPIDALRAATRGTGVAVAGSAATSMIGFAILALAPMPLFASYGLLTALMILLALLATLLVLPGLLLLVTPGPRKPANDETPPARRPTPQRRPEPHSQPLAAARGRQAECSEASDACERQ